MTDPAIMTDYPDSVVFQAQVSMLDRDIPAFLDTIGFDAYFDPGDKVIVKPNFVAPRSSDTGATTNLDLVRHVALRLRQLGAEPILCEIPGMEFRVFDVFLTLGLLDLCKQVHMPFHIPKRQDFVSVNIPGGEVMTSVRIPRIAIGAKIVNLPVMKTHVITGVSLSRKNLMGLVHPQSRKWMHIRGIHTAIVDLNRLLTPTISILDAICGMEGDGAVYGNPVRLNRLFASADTLALDRTACGVMGVDPATIPHIGAGDTSVPETTPVHRFRLPAQGGIYRKIYNAMYAVDLVWETLFGIHFNAFLYRTGIVGTQPRIAKGDVCAGCRVCIEICPVKAIDQDFNIDRGHCLRCLRCYDNCPHGRINVKGYSSPEHGR